MAQNLGELTIREATVVDAGPIAEVHVTSWREAYRDIVPAEFLTSLDVERKTEHWQRWLTDGSSRTWVAVSDQTVIGFCTLGPARDEDAPPGTWQLYAIYMLPQAWGRGAARELMRTALGSLPAGTEVTLWVLAHNERAQRFYRRHGFSADGIERIEEFGGAPLLEVRYRRG